MPLDWFRFRNLIHKTSYITFCNFWGCFFSHNLLFCNKCKKERNFGLRKINQKTLGVQGQFYQKRRQKETLKEKMTDQEKINALADGLREIRKVALVSEGVEFYAMLAEKALIESEQDVELRWFCSNFRPH